MSISQTLADRAKTHGSFIDNGRVMQALKETCHVSPNWQTLSPDQREAVEMVCHKLGRILCGNPNEPDHWHDIAGYTTLEENILRSLPK